MMFYSEDPNMTADKASHVTYTGTYGQNKAHSVISDHLQYTAYIKLQWINDG